MIIIAIIIIAIKYSTWMLAKLENIDSCLKTVDEVGLTVHLSRHLVDGLNCRDRPYTGRFGSLKPVTSEDAVQDVLLVVDRSGLIVKLVVEVIKTEVDALDLVVQVLVGDSGLLDLAQTYV